MSHKEKSAASLTQKTATSRTEARYPPFKHENLLHRLESNAEYASNPYMEDFQEEELQTLCENVRSVFLMQPTLIEIRAPVRVCGDIHGQYGDLLRIFNTIGYPKKRNYLFLGDYVDRGRQNLETICLMFCYKVQYPERFFILRGNHECAAINRIYGFYDECKRRLSIRMWKTFQDVFNSMPLAALIDNRIFCMHGGLSKDLRNFDQIRRILRPTEIPDEGLMCDLLWSDPDRETEGFEASARGVSYTFGPDAVLEFCKMMNIDLVCRAHQVVEDGYEFFADRHLLTLFSAPNYCGQFDNAACIMSVDKDLLCSFTILRPLDKKADIPEAGRSVKGK